MACDHVVCGRLQRLYPGVRTDVIGEDLHHAGTTEQPGSERQVGDKAGTTKQDS